jgi:hypothetical protein
MSREIKDEISQELDAVYAAAVADRVWVSVQVQTRKTPGAIMVELRSRAGDALPAAERRSPANFRPICPRQPPLGTSRKRIVISVNTALDG